MNTFRIWFARFLCYLLVTLLIACNLPTNRSEQPTPFLPTMIQPTSASPTVAQFTPIEQPSLYSTDTNHPTNSVHSTDSAIAIPCNRAEFVNDVTILDGTQVSIGASFTKTWRIKNVGSCTWTSGYVLFFDHGDRMDAPGTQPLTSGNVAPGAVTELSVTLKAPSTPGMYQGDFRLRSPDNVLFGIGPSGQSTIWVRIVVPKLTETQSNTPTITLTNTPLTPLPDFEQVIGFGLGGGDKPCLYYDGRSLPSVEGSTVFDNYYYPRTAILCIWGVPFDKPLNITLTSPSRLLTLQATVQVTSSSNEVLWLGHASSQHRSAAAIVSEVSAIFLNIWWPANLDSGEWQASVRWEGEEVSGIFRANTKILPEIALFDTRFDKEIIPGYFHCHFVLPGDHLKIEGEGFPPDTLVYVLVYRSLEGSDEAHFLFGKIAETNQEGSLITNYDQSLGSGQYYVVGVTNPQEDLTDENGNLNFEAIGNAVDCFNI